MWFQKRVRNRRRQRRQVLDVKLRSSHARAARGRSLTVVAGLLLGTVFSLYVLWRCGEWVLNRLVYENRTFAIQQVKIDTDGVISIEQLRRWSGVKGGENLFALDLAQVKRNLELVPNIHSVAVERLLPRTLRIRVTERKPIAQVNLPRLRTQGGLGVQVWLLDADGAVMLPLNPAHRQTPVTGSSSRLPLLTGLSPSELRLGDRVESPRVLDALRVLDGFNRSGMAGLVEVQRVDVSAPGVLKIVTSEAAEITMRPDGFETQFLRWREIHKQSLRLNKVVLSLDLAVSNNVPVRWVDARAVPPRAALDPQGNRTRKNHV